MATIEKMDYREGLNKATLELRVDDTYLRISAYKSQFGDIVIDYRELETDDK